MKKIFTVLMALVCAANIYAQQLSSVGIGISGLYINDIEVYKGDLYAGGYFAPGGTASQHVLRFDGAAWKHMSGGISGGQYPFIKKFCVHNDKLFMTGAFTKTGTTTTLDFGVWNGTAWEDPKGGLNNAWTLVEYNNTLYAGTNIYLKDGGKAAFFWKWDTNTGWVNLSDSFTVEASPNFDLQGINAMMVYNGKLIVAGLFSEINGQTVNNIAEWDGSKWSKLGSGTNGDVKTLSRYYNKLYIGGSFDEAGGNAAQRLASWNGTAWIGYNTVIDYDVDALQVYDDDLYIGGSFFNPARGLIKYDGANFTTPFKLNGGVSKLLSYKNDLYIAGDFDTIDNKRFSLIAKFHIDGVGVQEVSKNTLKVYPNPATDKLVINITGLQEGKALVTIYDNLGRVVSETNMDTNSELLLPVNQLPQGTYWVIVKQDEAYVSGRFVKQ